MDAFSGDVPGQIHGQHRKNLQYLHLRFYPDFQLSI